MGKLDRKAPPQVQGSRNVFDLSHDILFTATTGMLLPVTHDMVMPGDTIKGKFNFFLRTMPISTAAMVDVKFYTDYFFVPIELFFPGFDAWFSRTNSNWLPYAESMVRDVNPPLLSFNFNMSEFWSNNPREDEYRNRKGFNVYNHASASDSYRLFDILGFSNFGTGFGFYGTTTGLVPAGPSGDNYYSAKKLEIFPWQLCAYQAIYQWYYRDDDFEPLTVGAYSIQPGLSNITADSPLIRLRYRNRSDDYFTSFMPSPMGGKNVLNLDNNWFSNDVNRNNLDLYSVAEVEFDSSNSSFVNLINSADAYNADDSSFTRSTAQLRALFAQEKFIQAVTMTRKNYDAQVMTRFGFDVPNDVKHNIRHLGHDVVSLDIREVMSGANTFNSETGQGSALGDLAGKGYAVSGKKGGFKFTAPCHGVIMTIWSCEALPKYIAASLRKDMVNSWHDFFQPEFDNLGLQPIYFNETAAANGVYYDQIINNDQLDLVKKLSFNPNVIVGWQYRYSELKRNSNRATSAFTPSDVLIYNDLEELPPVNGFNAFNSWSLVQTPFKPLVSSANTQVTDYYGADMFELYKVPSNQLDGVMLTKYNGIWYTVDEQDPNSPINSNTVITVADDSSVHPWLIYQTDPFIVDGRFDCQKISRMSIHSMPKYL